MRAAAGRRRALAIRCYQGAARAAAVYLRRGHPEASVYVTRAAASGDLAPGVSDLDLALVVPDDPAREHGEHRRAKRRWQRLTRALPLVRPLLHDLAVYERWELEQALSASILEYGLDATAGAGQNAAFFGLAPAQDEAELRTRPGLLGPARDWRLLAGPELRPPARPRDPQQRRLGAWLELQYWWRSAFHACAHREEPWAAYMCVKLVAEPAGILLALRGESPPELRADLLRAAAAAIPQEATGCERALALLEQLPGPRPAPLGEFLPVLVRLSEAIASELGAGVAAAPSTEVRLTGAEVDGGDGPVPLADWRAVVLPSLPDEILAPVELSLERPAELAEVAGAAGEGRQPCIRHGELLLEPAVDPWRQGLFRCLQAPFSDPVSFALLAGEPSARFPELEGWCARDWARRAVGEHAAWLRRGGSVLEAPTAREWIGLADPGAVAPPVRALAKLLTALRAGLFLESVDQGSPELAVTVGAAAHTVAGSGRDPAGAAAEAASHFYAGGPRSQPHQSLLEATARVVRSLPAYGGVGARA